VRDFRTGRPGPHGVRRAVRAVRADEDGGGAAGGASAVASGDQQPTHVPLTQRDPAPHAMPHAPQFVLSDDKLRHVPEQFVSPG